jgi:hypothetical protein
MAFGCLAGPVPEVSSRSLVEALDLIIVEVLACELGADAPLVFLHIQKDGVQIDDGALVSSFGHLFAPKGIILPPPNDRMSLSGVGDSLQFLPFAILYGRFLDGMPVPFRSGERRATAAKYDLSGLYVGRVGIDPVWGIVPSRGFPLRGAILAGTSGRSSGRMGIEDDVPKMLWKALPLHVAVEAVSAAHEGSAASWARESPPAFTRRPKFEGGEVESVTVHGGISLVIGFALIPLVLRIPSNAIAPRGSFW